MANLLPLLDSTDTRAEANEHTMTFLCAPTFPVLHQLRTPNDSTLECELREKKISTLTHD